MKHEAFIRQSIQQNLADIHVSQRQQNRLIDEITEGKKMRRKLPICAALATILIFVSVTALAVGVSGFFGSMNWLGKVIPEEQFQQPFATQTPAPQGVSMGLFDLEQEIMDSRAERELVHIEEENGGSWTKRTQTVHNMEEFNHLMKTISNLPIPSVIPEGYRFSDGYVVYACRSNGEYELVSHEKLHEGITVSRYQVDESMDFISGYDLTFTGSGSEDYISINVSLEELTDVTEYSMGINPDEQARVLEVQGMDNAIVITSEETTYLAMRRALDVPLEYLEFVPNEQAEVHTFVEIQIDVFARSLSEETLIGMFKDK